MVLSANFDTGFETLLFSFISLFSGILRGFVLEDEAKQETKREAGRRCQEEETIFKIRKTPGLRTWGSFILPIQEFFFL